jgi:diguanylate cyclase
MFENDTLQKASEYAKSALLRLEFLGLAPTPNNYSLMYAYTSGRIPEIKPIIDDAIRKGGLNVEQMKSIHEKYLGLHSDRDILESNLRAMTQELQHVMGILGQAKAGTDQFNQTLSNFTGDLNKPLSVEQFRATVNRVVSETKAITQQNQQLQEKLDESSQQLGVLKEDLNKAQKESLTDPLTSVGNRKHFVNELKRLVFEADDQKTPLSLLMIDIDYFKKFNDTHGHLVGDQVLKLVARTLMENVKGRDVVARYGGEEFVIVLPQTKLADANKVAEALRQFVAQKKIIRRDNNQNLGGVTISMGVAQYHSGEALSQLMRRADAGVYMAKNAGRNRVVVQDLDPDTISKIMGDGQDRFAELEGDTYGTPAPKGAKA